MQITLNLDDSLFNEALQLTSLTTQDELINLALQELVRSRRRKNLLDLAGQIQLPTLTTKTCVSLVMLLIDTSVWINVFRDRSGQVRQQLEALIADRDFETIAQVRSLQHLRF